MSNESILTRVLSSENLPTLPNVAVEVLALTKRGDATAEKLAAIVQRDPVITAKILKLINSSLYAMPRQITSVKQAISLMGLRSVTVTLLSLALVEGMKPKDAEGLGLEQFWCRSLSTATGARMLAKCANPALAEDAFIAGLLCDLGVLATWSAAHTDYQPVLESARSGQIPLHQAELKALGVTHAQIGRELIQSWKLPDLLCHAVGAHADEGELNVPETSRPLASIVRAAARIAAVFAKDVPASEFVSAREKCIEELALTPEAVDEILGTLDTGVKDTARVMGLSVGQSVNYAQIQAEAAMAMVKLTMQAETDRSEAARRAETAQLEAKRLTEEKASILQVAATDGLTKIANRAAFDTRLAEEHARACAGSAPLALVMIDVDHFKKFNDTHGHQAGDAVLKTVAKTIAATVANCGFVARYGGEEFSIILAGPEGTLRNAAKTAERVRAAIESGVVNHDGKSLKVTASFGVALANDHAAAESPARLIEQADKRLYLAKKAGRNRVVASDLQMAKAA